MGVDTHDIRTIIHFRACDVMYIQAASRAGLGDGNNSVVTRKGRHVRASMKLYCDNKSECRREVINFDEQIDKTNHLRLIICMCCACMMYD